MTSTLVPDQLKAPSDFRGSNEKRTVARQMSSRIPSAVRTDGMTCHCDSSYDFTNSKRSALIVAASVVGMPWGKPL
jgi:hypothetical protein